MKNHKYSNEKVYYVSETVVEIKDCLNYLNWMVEGDKKRDLGYLEFMLDSVDTLERDIQKIRTSLVDKIILKKAGDI